MPTAVYVGETSKNRESDELSSEECNAENAKLVDMPLLQGNIKKNYKELEKKFNQEFDQKTRKWDIKNEATTKTNDLFHNPLNEDKIVIPKFKRNKEANAVPLPSLNDLSPEFRKKLNDWKKMKSTQGSIPSSTAKEDVQGPKIKIGEWQPWKSRSVKHFGKCEKNFFDEYRKSEIKNNLYTLINQGKEVNNSWKDLKGKEHIKKINSSGGDFTTTWNPNEPKLVKRMTKAKDFEWVEKELQKIVREKMRLEEEKKKYLQKEARLKQMKRTMVPTFPAQEILVKTPTGLIRFKGISKKFTKKLYEWEKAQGITPEASTFTLLERKGIRSTNSTFDGEIILQRSKSLGSIADLSSALLVPEIAHYPSSLSLNDVDELKTLTNTEKADILDEPLSSDHFRFDSDKEREALLVEVEDIVEEAKIETEIPVFKKEIPKYTFVSDEYNYLVAPNEGQPLTIHCDSKESEFDNSKKNISKPVEKEINCRREKMDKVNCMEQMNKSSEISTTITQPDSNENKAFTVAEVNTQYFLKKEIQKIQNNESVTLETIPVFFPIFKSTTTECLNFSDNIKSREEGMQNKATNEAAVEKNKIQTAEPEIIEKSESKSGSEAIKQKINEKIILMQRMSTDVQFYNKWKYKSERGILDEKTVGRKNELTESSDKYTLKFLPNEFKSIKEEDMACLNSVNVFVPTIRKIYSPIKTEQRISSIACSYVLDNTQAPEASLINKYKTCEDDKDIYEKKFCKSNFNQSLSKKSEKLNFPAFKESLLTPSNRENRKSVHETENTSRIIGISSIPNSLKTYNKRNLKESAPSIQIIIDKYNQKSSDKKNKNEDKNDEEFLIGWRSPVFRRRSKEKAENYIKKSDEFSTKNNEVKVQKSVSFDAVKSSNFFSSQEILCNENLHEKNVFKSNSLGIIKLPLRVIDSHSIDVKKLNEPEANLDGSSTTLRALKIKKAKEDFLSGRHSVSSDASSTSSVCIKYSPDRFTLSNKFGTYVEAYDTSADNNLIKSVSAETISFQQSPIQNEHQSFNENNFQKSSSKFDLFSIKSKFRRMKWKRDKDCTLSSVATLCRQSLLIEVPGNPKTNLTDYNLSTSCPSSPVMTRTKQNGDKKYLKKKEK